MFEKQLFVKSVYDLKELPQTGLPEIILCGRSNVGKSSFINSLFNRKDLAKVSSTPGKTRSINYYLIDDAFYIVDLPGYGFARTSKKEREFWGHIISDYMKRADQIKLALHFIDSRHHPTDLDIQFNEFLNTTTIPYFFILSKTDKLKQSEYHKAGKLLKEYFPEISFGDNILFYSSVKKNGRKEVLKLISSLFLQQ